MRRGRQVEREHRAARHGNLGARSLGRECLGRELLRLCEDLEDLLAAGLCHGQKVGDEGKPTAALTTAKSSTLLFQQQLMRLGPPAGSPSQVTQQLRQYANRLKTSNQSLQAVLSEPGGSASELKTKVQSARATLTVMSTQLQQAYAYLTGVNASPQLKQALTSNATCRATFG